MVDYQQWTLQKNLEWLVWFISFDGFTIAIPTANYYPDVSFCTGLGIFFILLFLF